MEPSDRLKFILLGLFLAAIAVGYLIFTQRFAGQRQPSSSPRPIQQIIEVSPSSSPSPTLLGETTGDGQQQTTKGGQPLPNTGVSTLPKTGGPLDLLGLLAASAAVTGYFLRKFPN